MVLYASHNSQDPLVVGVVKGGRVARSYTLGTPRAGTHTSVFYMHAASLLSKMFPVSGTRPYISNRLACQQGEREALLSHAGKCLLKRPLAFSLPLVASYIPIDLPRSLSASLSAFISLLFKTLFSSNFLSTNSVFIVALNSFFPTR